MNINNKDIKFEMIQMTNCKWIIAGPENILPHQTYASKSFIVSALDEFQYTERDILWRSGMNVFELHDVHFYIWCSFCFQEWLWYSMSWWQNAMSFCLLSVCNKQTLLHWNTLEHSFQTLLIFVRALVSDGMFHNHTMQGPQELLFMYVFIFWCLVKQMW